MLPPHVTEPVARGLDEVERILDAAVAAAPGDVGRVARDILDRGGKRLRPILALLAAKAVDPTADAEATPAIAAAVEMLHTASLLHDDVIDDATIRRGAPAAHVEAGAKAAVLAGDLLFARALGLLARHGGDAAVTAASEAIGQMIDGEATERAGRGDFAQAEARVLAVSRAKTGALFALATRLGARSGRASPEVEQALAEFGMRVGLAFQLVDDVLDLRAPAAVLGKQPGTDLREGTVTLPLLWLFAAADEDERCAIERASRDGSHDDTTALLGRMAAQPAVDRVLARAREETIAALDRLRDLPVRAARTALETFARSAVERDR